MTYLDCRGTGEHKEGLWRRAAPCAGPSRGLRGQATAAPMMQFYAAASVHICAAIDSCECMEEVFDKLPSRQSGAQRLPRVCFRPAVEACFFNADGLDECAPAEV